MTKLIDIPKEQWLNLIVKYNDGAAKYVITAVLNQYPKSNQYFVRIRSLHNTREYVAKASQLVLINDVQNNVVRYQFFYNIKKRRGRTIITAVLVDNYSVISSLKKQIRRVIVRKDDTDIEDRTIAFLMAWGILHTNDSRTQFKKKVYEAVKLLMINADDSVPAYFRIALRGVLMGNYLNTGGTIQMFEQLMEIKNESAD